MARWARVDRYFTDLFDPEGGTLQSALAASERAGLPPIQVSRLQGRLLYLLARLQGARQILEIGTLGGFSAICLARALPPEGRMITLELEPRHAEVARANLSRAGLGDRVEVRVGPALDSLAALDSEHRGPFDLVFIDADKPGYPEYLTWAVRLSRPGGLIVADNVVRGGAVADPNDPDPRVQGVRRFCDQLASDARVEGVGLPMVGAKGYDGLVIARVRDRGGPGVRTPPVR